MRISCDRPVALSRGFSWPELSFWKNYERSDFCDNILDDVLYLSSLIDDTTGTESIHTIVQGHEIMFHVSTMLPHSKHSQQVGLAKHLIFIVNDNSSTVDSVHTIS